MLSHSATLIEAQRVARQTREESFSRAVDQMIGNLDQELQTFRERIKQDQSVTVSYRAGYAEPAGGAVPAIDSAALLLLALCRLWRRVRSARPL